MLDPVTISGMFDSVKALTGLAKATADAVVDEKVREKVYEIRQGLMDLQERALEIQRDRMELLEQVSDLRKELAALKTKEAKLSGYEMHSLAAGVTVYKSKPNADHTVDHYACPDCFSKNEVSILQRRETPYGSTEWKCQKCGFIVLV